MNGTQKLIKYLAMALAAVLAVGIIAVIVRVGVEIVASVLGMERSSNRGDFLQEYEGISSLGTENSIGMESSFNQGDFLQEYEGISSLDIENDIGYLNIKIAEGDKIKVEASNINERFFVKAQGHTLKIKNEEPSEKIFTKEERRDDCVINLYLPKDFVAQEVEIEQDAGVINIERLYANELEIDGGAGSMEGTDIKANRVQLSAGMGEWILTQVQLNNLELETGVGSTQITGIVTGRSSIECGVGEVILNLNQPKSDFGYKIREGIGQVTFNGETVSPRIFENPNGAHFLEIQGGIGAVDVTFADAA